ncbi:MAG: flagellar biosynthetic protein FliR [Anaeromicrobium sp.]|jgi:flagellar biosynthetic protein FliR|uniref:flagellar biosynthetic protein FliR n=1 Tax=Anaeromicrobium sp. TaxID=1929132 RepID=UPI0025D30C0F|nr:flagellar biosynthetic protein FliR [Anaeromicrobium sp.]MCT4595596.1 flagellar biosynthetic protein FliR [Anaeromicrobium sp.]
MDIVLKILNNKDIFLLVLSRIIGIMVSIPFFRDKMILSHIKIILSFLIAIIIFPFIEIESLIDNSTFLLFGINIVKESIIGMSIGMIAYLYYTIVYMSGFIIDLQMGFSMASVISPQDDTQVPLTANFFYLISILVFLSTNSHHKVIYAIVDSFKYIPIDKTINGTFILDLVIRIFSMSFVIAFKIAAPVIVSTFLANVLLGILAKTMPQMNVFVVGMPLKIIVGLSVLVILLPIYLGVYTNIAEIMVESIYEFFNSIARG